MQTKLSSTYLVGILGGCVGFLLYFLCILISWQKYPSLLSPISNWMSDLGNSSLNPQGAIWFNLANLFYGTGSALFYGGFSIWYSSEEKHMRRVRLTQSMGYINSFNIVMIGIFPEDYGIIHNLWAGVFFLGNLVLLVFIFIAFRSHSQSKWIARYSLFAAVINCGYVFGVIPLLEWITILTCHPLGIMLWAWMILSFRQSNSIKAR